MAANIDFTIRSWADFATQGYSAPQGAPDVQNRLQQNPKFYVANYTVVIAAIVLLTSYFYTELFATILIVGITAGILFFLKDQTLQLGGVVITPTMQIGALVVEALLVIYIADSFQPLLYSSLFGVVVCLGHAVMKEAQTAVGSFKSSIKGAGAKASSFVSDVRTDIQNEFHKLQPRKATGGESKLIFMKLLRGGSCWVPPDVHPSFCVQYHTRLRGSVSSRSHFIQSEGTSTIFLRRTPKAQPFCFKRHCWKRSLAMEDSLPRLRAVALDFDKTLTESDTIQWVVEESINSSRDKDAKRAKWEELVAIYNAAVRDYMQTLMEEQHHSPSSDEQQRQQRLRAFFEAQAKAEHTTLPYIQQHKLLSGVTRERWRNLWRKCGGTLQASAVDTLAEMRASTRGQVEFYILSSGWNKEFIWGCAQLHGLVASPDHILSNDTVYAPIEEGGHTTGELTLSFVTAFDKEACIKRLQAQHGPLMYVGDSLNDLLALMAADVGVLLCPSKKTEDENKMEEKSHVMTVMERFGVRYRTIEEHMKLLKETELSGEGKENAVILATSWTQIGELFRLYTQRPTN
ncbi:hypothetical protein QOT17_010254 [Balamuthia mandrillaris]